MATERVTIDLSEDAMNLLRADLVSGKYHSQSEAIESALLSRDLPHVESFDPADPPQWFIEDAVAASRELDAYPERALTSAQVDEYLAEQRALQHIAG